MTTSEGVSIVSAASYPRRQQTYRLKRAVRPAAAAVATAVVGVLAGLAGFAALAGMLLLTAAALGLYARHWVRPPARSGSAHAQRTRSGARSERSRARAGGCATPSAGTAPATSTKSRARRPASRSRSKPNPHLPPQPPHQDQRAGRLAAPSSSALCPHGALPVLCVTRGRIEQAEHGVLVVSVDRLRARWRTAGAERDPVGA
jgi:hypothetical protein